MLNIVLAEAALELVPSEILRHPSVRRNAKRRGKKPGETLLNRSLHHSAMTRLEGSEKRGRPDIVNICLLILQGSPLNREGHLRTYINTGRGLSISVTPEARLPRDCNRFNNLMEQLLIQGQVPPKSDKPLMSMEKKPLVTLKEEISPSLTVALTSHGEPTSMEDLSGRLAGEENPLVLVGAYPHGPLSEETLGTADMTVSIYREGLETWTVVSRLIYEYEKNIGL
jgi:rRNA small subunit pseudouridine methyltransferase Nep1